MTWEMPCFTVYIGRGSKRDRIWIYPINIPSNIWHINHQKWIEYIPPRRDIHSQSVTSPRIPEINSTTTNYSVCYRRT